VYLELLNQKYSGLQNIPLIAHRNNKCTYNSGWKTSCNDFSRDLSLNGKIINLTLTNRCSDCPIVQWLVSFTVMNIWVARNFSIKYQLSREGRSISFIYLWVNDAQHWTV